MSTRRNGPQGRSGGDDVFGRPIELAGLGWLVSVALGFGVAAILHAEGRIISTLVIGLCLVTTSLGTLIPTLKDDDLLGTRFGVFVVGAGTIGEFGPIVLVSLLLGVNRAGRAAVFLAVFTAIAVAAAVLALRWRPTRVVALVQRTMRRSEQLAVRLSWLLLVLLLYVTSRFGLDVILGAFAAGLVVGLVAQGPESDPVRAGLDAIGYGVFIPVFFVASGMNLDVGALFSSLGTALRLPAFLVLLLIVRGLPAVLYRRELPRTDLIPLALLSATAFPLIVAITAIAVETGQIKPAYSVALIGAGVVSISVFPMVAFALRREGV